MTYSNTYIPPVNHQPKLTKKRRWSWFSFTLLAILTLTATVFAGVYVLRLLI